MFPNSPDRVLYGGFVKIWNGYSLADKLITIHTCFMPEDEDEIDLVLDGFFDKEFSGSDCRLSIAYVSRDHSMVIAPSVFFLRTDMVTVLGFNLPPKAELLRALFKMLEQDIAERETAKQNRETEFDYRLRRPRWDSEFSLN